MKSREEVSAMLELHRRGWSPERIAGHLQCSAHTVARYLVLGGWRPRAGCVLGDNQGENPATIRMRMVVKLISGCGTGLAGMSWAGRPPGAGQPGDRAGCLTIAGSPSKEDHPCRDHNVTDRQMRIYMNHRRSEAPAVAAARAGFSTATAYRVENSERRPRGAPRGRRRPDPLEGIFEEEIVPILTDAPGVRAVWLYEELMRLHPELPSGVRRTLERRVRAWKAEHAWSGSTTSTPPSR